MLNQENRLLWEVLVPTFMNGKPIKTKHHKQFDKMVRKISGGLSIFLPIKGQWFHPDSNELISERMIPVRFMATREEMDKVALFTVKHYCQHSVLVYKISDEVYFKKFK